MSGWGCLFRSVICVFGGRGVWGPSQIRRRDRLNTATPPKGILLGLCFAVSFFGWGVGGLGWPRLDTPGLLLPDRRFGPVGKAPACYTSGPGLEPRCGPFLFLPRPSAGRTGAGSIAVHAPTGNPIGIGSVPVHVPTDNPIDIGSILVHTYTDNPINTGSIPPR